MSTESAAAEVAEPEAPEAGAGPDAEDTPEAGSTPSGGAAPDGDPGDAEEHSADPEDAAPDSTGDGAEAGGGEGQDGSGDGGDTGVSEAEAELAAQRELRARIEQRKADKKGPVAAGAKLQGTVADLLAAVRAVESGEKPVAPVFREPAPVAPRRPAPEPVRRPVAEAPAGAG
ncbi:DNA helicase RecD, partial [Streptomyces sp. LNU-CPARS28]